MIRSLFLILTVLSFTVFGQTNFFVDNPMARKIDEFERASNEKVKMRIDAFFAEMQKDSKAQAYIINYGSKKEIAIRRKQILDAINVGKYHEMRKTFVEGGYSRIIKTELWSVPSGVSKPVYSSSKVPLNILEPIRFEKISVQSENFYQWLFGEYLKELKAREGVNGYILINADEAEYTNFEKKIREYMRFANVPSEKIYFRAGKPENPMTSELWFVPKELESPNFTKKAEKLAEFGKLPPLEWKRRMKGIAKTIREIRYESSQLYIVTYGSEQEVSVGERLIEKYLLQNCRECFGYTNFKINFVRGSANGKARRAFWLVPENAEVPKF